MSAHRLLVITYHFGSSGAVGGLRWTGITKYLVRLGWEVRVITAAPPPPSPGHASVESCPRFWTILDACRLLRRLAVRQSLASFPDGSWSEPGTEFQGLLGKVRSEVAAFLAFPDESRGWVFRAALRALGDPAIPTARRRQQRPAALRPPRGGDGNRRDCDALVDRPARSVGGASRAGVGVAREDRHRRVPHPLSAARAPRLQGVRRRHYERSATCGSAHGALSRRTGRLCAERRRP